MTINSREATSWREHGARLGLDGVRVAVTGGSGFIGTNIVAFLEGQGVPVVNFDLCAPRNEVHRSLWIQLDVREGRKLAEAFRAFKPTHVIHLAARTDLRGTTLQEYVANTEGVEMLLEGVSRCGTVQRLVVASSMLVCPVGYRPRGDDDYAPSTVYGQSKSIGERLVRASNLGETCWVIVRPTSIWGPWFGEPYREFFDAVLARRFVKFRNASARKTFGYVGNTVFQFSALLCAPRQLVERRTLYLGDRPPLSIDFWAEEIARQAGVPPPRTIPMELARVGARVGDLLQGAGIRAPITSFRLTNMTTDSEVSVEEIHSVAGEPPFSLSDGIRETLEWLSRRKVQGNVRTRWVRF